MATNNVFFQLENLLPVMICSLSGAILYIQTYKGRSVFEVVSFVIVSFIGGIACADTVATITSDLIDLFLNNLNINSNIKVPPEVGSLIASTIIVSVLIKLLKHIRK